jgi:hypothetical protein
MGAGMIPVFGMITGIVTTGLFFWGVVQLARSPIGQALARRIQGRHGAADADLQADVLAMRDQLDYMQQQLSETQEHLDFTERLMSQQRQGLIGEARHE